VAQKLAAITDPSQPGVPIKNARIQLPLGGSWFPQQLEKPMHEPPPTWPRSTRGSKSLSRTMPDQPTLVIFTRVGT
jgi:hypothetical protein